MVGRGESSASDLAGLFGPELRVRRASPFSYVSEAVPPLRPGGSRQLVTTKAGRPLLDVQIPPELVVSHPPIGSRDDLRKTPILLFDMDGRLRARLLLVRGFPAPFVELEAPEGVPLGRIDGQPTSRGTEYGFHSAGRLLLATLVSPSWPFGGELRHPEGKALASVTLLRSTLRMTYRVVRREARFDPMFPLGLAVLLGLEMAHGKGRFM